MGVVLTGMGDDGAKGALELQRAGGCVLVQSAATAEHPSMPQAAIAGGAATMVLPLDELGLVVAELVAGTSRRQLRSEREAVRRIFGAAGETSALARERDWSSTALGPAFSWPGELRLIVRTVMDSPFPAAVWWGPELIQVYNDAWSGCLGVLKHPTAFGAPARETWSEVWHEIGPVVRRVFAEGIPQVRHDCPGLLERSGLSEETFLTFSHAPLRDMSGTVVAIHCTVWETTRTVVAERRLKALRDVAAQMAGACSVRVACERAAAALVDSPQDAPLVLLYLVDPSRPRATLAAPRAWNRARRARRR